MVIGDWKEIKVKSISGRKIGEKMVNLFSALARLPRL